MTGAAESGSAPARESSWFTDQDRLLGELRVARAAVVPPSIPGYDDLIEHRRGGQGIVFTAIQRSTRRQVAVKVLLHGAFAEERRRLRLQREAALAATLQHEHIVRVHDTGVTPEGWPYLVMELVDGVALDDWAATNRAPRVLIPVFVEIAAALAHAHQRGVIHRDLKPSNIRVDGRGEPRLLDFGLARALVEEPGSPSLSHSGELLGSLPWTSPEQAAGHSAAADVRSDVYSFGVVLYHALTGAFPYPVSGDLRAVLAAIQEQPAQPPSRHASIDRDLDTIVLGCLAKDPARRYQGAGEVGADLERWLRGEPIAVLADSTWYVMRTHLRRHRGKVAFGLALLVALLAFSLTAVVLWRRAASAEVLAKERLAESAWVNGFLARVLGGAHPDRGGRDRRVVDLLAEAGGELRAQGTLPPRAEAAACQALGASYAGLGVLEAAEPWLTRAMGLRLRHEGPTAAATFESLLSLAELRRDQGRVDAALELVRGALAAGASLPRTDPGVLAVRRADASLRMLRGDSGAVDALRSLVAEMRTCGAPGELLASTLGDLALALQGSARTAEAIDMFAAAIACEPSGDRSTRGLTFRDNRAQLLACMGEFAAAEAELRAVLADREEVLGPGHPLTLVSCGALANVLSARDQAAAAEPLLRRAADGLATVYGPDHAFALAAQQNLAVLEQRLGRAGDAATRLQSVVAARSRTQGPRHRDTLKTQDALAVAQWQAGQRESAYALAGQTVAAMRETLGEGHHDTAVATANLAMYLHHLGRLDEACSEFRRAVQASALAHGAGHFDVALSRRELARCLLDLGRPDEAAAELALAEPVLSATFGENHAEVRRCRDLRPRIEQAIAARGR